MSETWTLQRVLNWTIGYFNEKHIPEPRLSAELLLAHVLDCKRIELYVQFERLLSPEERADYRALIQRRAAREKDQNPGPRHTRVAVNAQRPEDRRPDRPAQPEQREGRG